MKKIGLYLAMILVIGAGLWEFSHQKSTTNAKIQSKRLLKWDLDTLKRIQVTSGSETWTYEKRGLIWWIVEPVLYPVRRQTFEGHFQMMTKILAEDVFIEAPKLYRFEAPTKIIDFESLDGESKRIFISPLESETGKIYVMDPAQPDIFVFHGAWAQFARQPWEAMLSDLLWPAAEDVSQIQWWKNGKRLWSLLKSKEKGAGKGTENEWTLRSGKVSKSLTALESSGIRRSWSLVTVSDLKLNQGQIGFLPSAVLKVTTQSGELQVFFDDTLGQVFLEAHKASGRVDRSALKETLKLLENSI